MISSWSRLGRAHRSTVAEALASRRGIWDLVRAQALMAQHQEAGRPAICRHEVPGSPSTISSVVFLPAERRMHFRSGPPCRSGEPTDLRIPACT